MRLKYKCELVLQTLKLCLNILLDEVYIAYLNQVNVRRSDIIVWHILMKH